MTPLEVLDRARHDRVDLGTFSAEELWRAGVPLPGAQLVEPAVAKVVGQERGRDDFDLSLEPLPLLLSRSLADAAPASEEGRALRLVCFFPQRFTWVERRSGLRRRTSWRMEHEELTDDDRVYLELWVRPGEPPRVKHQLSPAAAGLLPGWTAPTEASGVVLAAVDFFATLWDRFAPGPRPASG